jgi:hypothetical protein
MVDIRPIGLWIGVIDKDLIAFFQEKDKQFVRKGS